MKKRILIFIFTIGLSSAAFAANETLTITTYYPSPYAGFNNLYVANTTGVGTTNPNSSGGTRLTVEGGAISHANSNNFYGNDTTLATHVNLGIASTTGINGGNYTHATVFGGYNNTARATCSVGGGVSNAAWMYGTILGGLGNNCTSTLGVISGGMNNTAKTDYAAIGGGYNNTVSNASFLAQSACSYSAVLGGYSNRALNTLSVVAGGVNNTVLGNSSVIGGGSDNNVTGNFSAIFGGDDSEVSGDYSFVGGTYNIASGTYSTVTGGGALQATGKGSFVLGGGDGIASGVCSALGGGGGGANVASGTNSTVGGGYNNTATGNDTVFGSGSTTIFGGFNNYVGDWATTIIGGDSNKAPFHSVAIGGGHNNTAKDYAPNSVIGGGYNNSVTDGYIASVGGGRFNRAQAYWAVVEGGGYNNATSTFGWAGGYSAEIWHPGSFIWGGTGSWCRTNADNSFNIYADAIYFNGMQTYPADIAEHMNVAESQIAQETELVSLIGTDLLGQTKSAYDANLLGVISSKRTATFHLGNAQDPKEGTQRLPVALVGRCYVKVCAEEGNIELGDAVTSSSIPGTGMKAAKSGKILGYAMEKAEFKDPKEIKEILVFVKLDDYICPDDLENLRKI
ncbi:MAG: hypothetical protein WC532_09315 [Candidatus Omnitrophota bacterium]